MHNNYDRLFQQLTELIKDPEIYDSLDVDLQSRVNNLLKSNQKTNITQTIKELSIHDTEPLFTKNSQSQVRSNFQNIPLRDSTNESRGAKKNTQNGSNRIQGKKVQISAFDDERRLERSSSKGLLNNKNRNKSSKDLVRYNMQMSRSKSKQKERSKSKYGCIQSNQRDLNLIKNSGNIEKLANKINVSSRFQKQNAKIQPKRDKKETFIKKKGLNEMTSSEMKQKNKNNLYQSRQIIKRLATLQTEPSKIINFAKYKDKSTEKTCKMLEQQITIIQAIQQKQQLINQQRKELEYQIKYMQQLIQKQKISIQMVNNNIVKLNNQIYKRQTRERSSSQQIKISRKKSQNYKVQTKQIEKIIVQTNKGKQSIQSSIDEERYLVNMYLTVIEELKSQLKIEQTQKLELIKKLMLLKNTEKMCMEKYYSRQTLNNQIFKVMHQSLKKWI